MERGCHCQNEDSFQHEKERTSLIIYRNIKSTKTGSEPQNCTMSSDLEVRPHISDLGSRHHLPDMLGRRHVKSYPKVDRLGGGMRGETNAQGHDLLKSASLYNWIHRNTDTD